MTGQTGTRSEGMSIAGLVFGILAVLSSVLVFPTAFNAPLAITFALLSRGDGKLCAKSIAAIILSVIAIIISVAVAITVIVAAITVIMDMINGMGGASDFLNILEEAIEEGMVS